MNSFAFFLLLLGFQFFEVYSQQFRYANIVTYNSSDATCSDEILIISSIVIDTCFPIFEGNSEIVTCDLSNGELNVDTDIFGDDMCSVDTNTVLNFSMPSNCGSSCETALAQPNGQGVQVDFFGTTDCSGSLFQREFRSFELESGECIPFRQGSGARVICDNDCSACSLEVFSDNCFVLDLIESFNFSGNGNGAATSSCIVAPFGGFQATCLTTNSNSGSILAAAPLFVFLLFLF